MEFRVYKVWSLSFGAWGLGLRVRVWDLGFTFRVWDLGRLVWSLGFSNSGFLVLLLV